jgi:diaminopimelate decarboxylase
LSWHILQHLVVFHLAGVLLTKVDLLKPTSHRNFAIIDAAMNDLIRPALYINLET